MTQRNARAQRYRVRWQRYAKPGFYYLMFSPAELEQLVAGVGWRVLPLIVDESPRFAAVLERERRDCFAFVTPVGYSANPIRHCRRFAGWANPIRDILRWGGWANPIRLVPCWAGQREDV